MVVGDGFGDIGGVVLSLEHRRVIAQNHVRFPDGLGVSCADSGGLFGIVDLVVGGCEVSQRISHRNVWFFLTDRLHSIWLAVFLHVVVVVIGPVVRPVMTEYEILVCMPFLES